MTAVSVKTLEELKKTLLRRMTCVYQILLIYRTSLKLGGLNHKELRQNFPFWYLMDSIYSANDI